MLTIKLEIEDHLGARAVLDDLFLILGRDPELLSQLDGVNLRNAGLSLLEGALSVDPLDPDNWWELTSQEGGVEAFVIVSEIWILQIKERIFCSQEEWKDYSMQDMKMNISS